MAGLKMTQEQWIEFCKRLSPADVLFVETKNFFDVGTLIQWGTGNGNWLDPAHAFQYVGGDGNGRTIEADGKAVNWHIIDEYRDKVMKGDNRLVVMEAKEALTVPELELIKKVWAEQHGKKYDIPALIGFGFYGIINRIFPPLGGLMRKFMRNPLAGKDMYVCSRQVRTSFKLVKRIYEVLTKGKFEESETPESLCERINLTHKLKMDTYRIAKHGFDV